MLLDHAKPATFRPFTPLATLTLAALTVVTPAHAYPDTSEEDVIVDAPWKTVRPYLPVLYFFPEFNRPSVAYSNKVKSISLYNYDRTTSAVADPIFIVGPAANRTDNCGGDAPADRISHLDANGFAHTGLAPLEERPTSMFHFVVRIPVRCIGIGTQKGRPGKHYLVGRVEWQQLQKVLPGSFVKPEATAAEHETYKVMEVFVDRRPLVKFHSSDRYYDIHVHTIAEQTAWDTFDPSNEHNVDAGRKAFGGPLAMLAEAAYALGLVDRQMTNGNWADFRNQLVTTDHNAFFSEDHGAFTTEYQGEIAWHQQHFDAGNPPGHGPTASTDGHAGEFRWYRETLGELSGEEVALQTPHRKGEDRLGAHYLAYGAPHFEGPWHGGKLVVKGLTGSENPNTLTAVMAAMAQEGGFGYAAHPYSSGFEWGTYIDRAIGLPPANSGAPGSDLIDSSGSDFSFKGIQVWNGKPDYAAWLNLKSQDNKFGSGKFDRIDPFVRDGPQRFVANLEWKAALEKTLLNYRRYIAAGLTYAFRENPNAHFIRKVYMSAGTDAHGDFNFETVLRSTAEAEADDIPLLHHAVGGTGEMNANAFGRVRTYVLAGSRTEIKEPVAAAVAAYRDGNAVLTDGPICRMALDVDCRLDPNGTDVWQDDPRHCVFKNADGEIGGGGAFGGLRTALVADSGRQALLQTEWTGRIDRSVGEELSISEAASNTGGTVGPQWKMALEIEGISALQADPLVTARTTVKLADSSRMSLRGYRDFAPIFDRQERAEPFAIYLRGDLHQGEGDNRTFDDGTCITNPVWLIPVSIEETSPARCPFEPGALQIAARFGATLASPSGGHPRPQHLLVMLYPLGSDGKVAGPPTVLDDVTWRSAGSGPGNAGGSGKNGYIIRESAIVAKNSGQIACPTENWNIRSHRAAPGSFSYAAIVSNIHDMHGNRLNDVGMSFTVGLTKQFPNAIPSDSGPSVAATAPSQCAGSKPSPKAEQVPAKNPRPETYEWMPGFYRCEAGEWAWIKGRWVPRRQQSPPTFEPVQ